MDNKKAQKNKLLQNDATAMSSEKQNRVPDKKIPLKKGNILKEDWRAD